MLWLYDKLESFRVKFKMFKWFYLHFHILASQLLGRLLVKKLVTVFQSDLIIEEYKSIRVIIIKQLAILFIDMFD